MCEIENDEVYRTLSSFQLVSIKSMKQYVTDYLRPTQKPMVALNSKGLLKSHYVSRSSFSFL